MLVWILKVVISEREFISKEDMVSELLQRTGGILKLPSQTVILEWWECLGWDSSSVLALIAGWSWHFPRKWETRVLGFPSLTQKGNEPACL